jgi:gentisate 1,2-dioxygenase
MDTTTFYVKPGTSAERRDLYERLNGQNTAPLWEVLATLVTPEPQSACVPALWRYDDIRPLLMDAGRLITAKEAERRVLVLENPGLRGQSQITTSLYAGVQLVMPGEVAASHRHAASALRFVIEGEGTAYTAVDGERTTMRPGDFVLTPFWTFHDHGNPGAQPVIWLDGLDVPIVNLFNASFADHHDEETQPLTRRDGDALARYGGGLLPIEHTPRGMSSPMFSYPYARTREVLDTLYRNGPVHPRHGVKMQYVNPVTGGYPMPTIAAFIQFFPAGFKGMPHRSTDATIFCVAEGRGRTQVGAASFAWGPHDIFVAPSWQPVSHEAREDAVLFSFSDRAAQKALGVWREEDETA